jgi:hypothetical protein
MSAVKLNFSLDAQVAVLMRQRAAELKVPTSRYLSDLVLQDVRRQQDELAAEGYQLLSADTAAFVDAALPLAAEIWPKWEITAQEGASPAEQSEPEGKGGC